MNSTSHDPSVEPRRRPWAKWLWLFVFLVFIAVVALAPWIAPLDERSFVVLDDGTKLIFLGLTQPTTPPAVTVAGKGGTKAAGPGATTPTMPPVRYTPAPGFPFSGSASGRAFHFRPDGPQYTWWKQRYRDVWDACPAWLQHWLPTPARPKAVDYHLLAGWVASVPKYCLWIHSTNPGFSTRDWSAFINGFSCSWGSYQGHSASSPTHAALATVPSTEEPIWWLDCQSIPMDREMIEVRFVSKTTAEEAVIEIRNPFYKAVK